MRHREAWCLLNQKKKVIENMIDFHPKNVIQELNPALVRTLTKVPWD